MKLTLIYMLLLFSFKSSAQEKSSLSYLIIRIETQRDYSMNRYGCSIIAEGGCDSARFIYNLKEYNFKKNAVNNQSSFNYSKSDTATSMYNFFNTPTEALNFMSKNGWTLAFVYTETFSGWERQEGSDSKQYPVTTVSSRPVYCFKK